MSVSGVCAVCEMCVCGEGCVCVCVCVCGGGGGPAARCLVLLGDETAGAGGGRKAERAAPRLEGACGRACGGTWLCT